MKNRMSGISLIELMIAMTLSAILMQGVIQLYLTIKQQFLYQQALSNIQQSIRVTHMLLGQWVRSDGSLGCLNIKHLPNLIQRRFDIQPPEPKHYGDVIWVREVNPLYHLKKTVRAGDTTFQIQEKIEIKKIKNKKTLSISDCMDAEIVELIHKSRFSEKMGTTLTVSKGIHGNYDLNTYIGWFESKIIYVAKTERKNKRGEPIFALYAKDIQQRVNEIVEGIVDLRVESLTSQSNEHGLRVHITVQDNEITSLKRTWTEEIWFR